MSDKQTQPVKVVEPSPRKKSWFGCWGSPDMRTVIQPVSSETPTQKAHSIGRSIPKSVDDNGSFGF
jgi:hypothetical protein